MSSMNEVWAWSRETPDVLMGFFRPFPLMHPPESFTLTSTVNHKLVAVEKNGAWRREITSTEIHADHIGSIRREGSRSN
jgi:hypothetical protein